MSNPLLWGLRHPALALTTLAWLSLLAGALVGVWWATTRNLIALRVTYRDGWYLLPPVEWTARALAVFVSLAATFGLLAAGAAALP